MNYSHKFFKFVAAVLLFVGFSTTGSALATSQGHGILNSGKGTGVPLFVIIEVNWDGTGNGDWVGVVWDTVVGAKHRVDRVSA